MRKINVNILLQMIQTSIQCSTLSKKKVSIFLANAALISFKKMIGGTC